MTEASMLEVRRYDQLSTEEWGELRHIMHGARYRRPPTQAEERLRGLLARRDARARTMEWHDLVSFGMVVLGGYFLYKALN